MQKTAYEMRISDWSSDVCSSDLIAGGSGKTPLAIVLVERLRAAGFNPGVATRGYGRDDAGTPRWVDADTDPALGGDEPVLIAYRTGARDRKSTSLNSSH